MGIQIGAKPDSGFDDPLGMLKDCHRRIERFLHILCFVAGRARGRGLTGEETEAIEAALHYFSAGGRRHTADEEESLFPRLRGQSMREEFAQLDGLERDHQRAEELHAVIETLYRKWIATGSLRAEDQEQILSATEDLRRLYEQHIRLEEQVVFPRAAAVLDRQAIAAMGQELRARRE
jgi:hemerythrin-like domain-containing protein